MHVRTFLLALTLAVAAQGAQAAPQLPPGVYAGQRNYGQAPAGSYKLDPDHTAVVARVSHIGYSYSVFRFDVTAGSLAWDPAKPEASRLTATVQTASIATPVKGFAAELAGDNFLKSKAFPEATFVSSAFRRVDDTHARVEGALTLMGKTAPVVFDVTLVGAGKGFMDHPRIGAHAVTQLAPADFGLAAMFDTPIELVIDAEFARD